MSTTLSLVESEALERSVNGLRTEQPDCSASRVLDRRQRTVLLGGLAVAATCVALWTIPTVTALVAMATAGYLLHLADRVWLFARGIGHSPEIRLSLDDVLAVPVEDLPVYTVLVPAYKEPEVVARLITNLGGINYPHERLDVKLLLEADDVDTVQVAREALGSVPFPVNIILVPPAEPRTKPKACNYGVEFARGDLVTIYDAEDAPDPLQLRRAALALQQVPDNVACLQAKLKYHNAGQNLLTRWFASEYNQWFGYILPGLMSVDAPIPLGGTSNHMHTAALREVGGWDPFNVTEDADLGIRLERHGYSTAILDSVTLEEANSDVINWLRQRSRWYKGYLQTFLVHMRHPRQLLAEMGWRNLLRFTAVTAGTPTIAVVNLVFWFLTLAWEIGAPTFIREIFPPFSFYPAIISLFFGNAAMIYAGVIACRQDRTPGLLLACLLVPAYWLLMSVAAVKAFVQLIFQPSYWEKTAHGLDAHRVAH